MKLIHMGLKIEVKVYNFLNEMYEEDKYDTESYRTIIRLN